MCGVSYDGYAAADVLANALDSVDVPDGTYAVKLVVDGINKLIFMHVAGNSAIELVAPRVRHPAVCLYVTWQQAQSRACKVMLLLTRQHAA